MTFSRGLTRKLACAAVVFIFGSQLSRPAMLVAERVGGDVEAAWCVVLDFLAVSTAHG